VNGAPMGSVLEPSEEREIEVAVAGGHALDYVEVLHNNRVIERVSGHELSAAADPYGEPFQIHMEVGWAERNEDIDWEVALTVAGGELLKIEPRFRGHEVVAPSATEAESYAFSHWERSGAQGVHFRTRTWGNPTTVTASTQGICLTVTGGPDTRIQGTVNGHPVSVSLSRLVAGPLAGYLGGFLTPSYYFQRAIPAAEATARLQFTHRSATNGRDWYYVRVRQTNDQWAWSSPIWVG
ncbi:MAG: hypothetical protein KDE19_23935, partial [Caldilineaceae bacterium]|nr:hypothetical protein [Caldilineaceae bacterium]